MKHNLYFHESTQAFFASYKDAPSQAVLLTGEEGVGLYTAATVLSESIVDTAVSINKIAPDEKGTISIETVRSLYISTRTSHTERQVVLIDDIDAMSFDAQNSFLKLLEEPTEHTYFIATSHHLEKLLPTILSRVQQTHIHSLSVNQTTALLKDLAVDDTTKRSQLLFIAPGLPAELSRLAKDALYFEKKSSLVKQAQTLLQGDTYTRLTLISGITDRATAQEFVRLLARIISFMFSKKHSPELLGSIDVIETVSRRLAANGHVRTQLSYLAVKIR